MSVVNKSIDWVRNHFDKDKVNKFSIVVILVYYYVGLLSYITTPWTSFHHLFISSSNLAVILRALMTILICLYSLLVAIVNEEKVQWKWVFVFIYILLFTLLSTALSPQTYTYILVSNGNYQTIYWVQASTGFNRLFTMFLSSISDFALAFCFLFILPIVINDKKQILLLTLPIVAVGLLECFYSVVTEKSEYIKLINFTDPQYGGYNISIGASFGNKQDWGAFANVAFISSIVSFVFLDQKKWKWLRVVLAVSTIVIFTFTVASLCKTAIFSELIAFIIIALFLVYYLAKKNRIVCVIYLLLLITLAVAVALFYTIPSFHTNGVLGKIYNVTYNYIIGKAISGSTIFGRTSIWLRFVENLRSYNLFFGLSKGGVSTYSQVVTVEGQSGIHNGFAYFFGSYGIMGFAVYLTLLALVIKRIIRLLKYNIGLFIIVFISLVAALIFSLVESEVLIVSGSNPIFVFNILVCVLPKGYSMKMNKKQEAVSSES